MTTSAEAPILVFGDDGSQGADVAWLWVNEQSWPDWRIEVLAVEPAVGGPVPTEEEATPHRWEPDVPRKYFADDVSGVENLTARADPRAVLGRRRDASLIVVGPRGRGFFKALRLGSVAEWLLQCPPAPMVLARSGRPVKRILVCIDGSAHAWLAARTCAALPLAQGADVIVLTVGTSGVPAPHDVERAAELFEAAGAASVDVIEVMPDPLQLFFNVRDVVIDLAKERAVDLIAMGTRGQSDWQSLRIGSTASSVTRYAEASMLLANASRT